jgi:hypothetical protein
LESVLAAVPDSVGHGAAVGPRCDPRHRGAVRKQSAAQSKTAVGGQRQPSGKRQVSAGSAAPPQVRRLAEWFITNSATTLDRSKIDV